MTINADEMIDETLLLIAESGHFDARVLNAFAALPAAQREIVVESLFRALPSDKQVTVLFRLKCFETRWNEVAL